MGPDDGVSVCFPSKIRRFVIIGRSWLVATSLWGIPVGISEVVMVVVFVVWLGLVVGLT